MSNKAEYFSRDFRNKRALQSHVVGQTLITGYYPLLESIEAVVAKQQDVINSLSGYCQELLQNFSEREESVNSKLTFLLKILYETALKNSDKSKKGHRFSDDIYMFAAYTFLIAGPLFYETLQINLPDSLPCVSQVRKYVNSCAEPIREGVFRFQELRQFLDSRGLPLKVWLSEDGTRLVSKFEWDGQTNQIVGPVLPVSEVHGTPILNKFPATSAALIAKHFVEGVPANIGYVVMARPMSSLCPTFCLAVFGTDNRFTAEHVSKRVDFLKTNLEREGIEFLGFSTDGDVKCLKAERAATFPPNPTVPLGFESFYFADTTQSITMIQDTIHLLNRFKTRLNKGSIVLPMGNFVASSSHLKMLVETVSKTEHGLDKYDLTKEDKMNFDATLKMCSERVTRAMNQSVTGAEATLVYLDLMKKIETAFLDSSLSPLLRVYNMWFVTFFVRLWRGWIQKSKDYRLGDNFITSNMYIGLEINAHGLIKVMRRLRDTHCDNLFLPSLMSSQACEEFFRKARSLTTTESTVINFSMLQFTHKVKRIEFLSDLECRMADKFEFLRERRKALLESKTCVRTEPLPFDLEIKETVETALADAKATASRLGMKSDVPNVQSYLLSELELHDDFYDEQLEHAEQAFDVDGNDFDGDDDVPLDILALFPRDVAETVDLLGSENENILESCSETDTNLPPTSKYVKVFGPQGSIDHMLKTTFCWVLRTKGPTVSVDRAMRFRQQAIRSFRRPQTLLVRNASQSASVSRVSDHVHVGEFVHFSFPKKIGCRVGQVLSFSYLSGNNCSYTLDSAPIAPPSKGARGIGVLCAWYNVNVTNGNLKRVLSTKHEFVDVKKYKCTIPSPLVKDDGSLYLQLNILESILSHK